MTYSIPCRIGDTVWAVRRNRNGDLIASQGQVSELFFTRDMELCIVVRSICRGLWKRDIFPTAASALREIGRRRGL